MLKEFMTNTPISLNVTLQEFQKIFLQETTAFIQEKSGVNLSQNLETLTSAEIEKIVEIVADIQSKIRANIFIPNDYKNFIVDFIMQILFEIWKKSDSSEIFFIKIRQYFTPAQIASSLFNYVKNFENYKWATNFFAEHKQIFPNSNKKIRTIGIYYFRIFNGGIERFLSLIIPIYIQQGYRVVLFTDVSVPELEYSLPPPYGGMFERVTFSTPRNLTFERLQELATLIQKYSIDVFVSHMRTADFTPFVQSLFCKLSGIKFVVELHSSIKHLDFRLPSVAGYCLADAVVVISRTRREFLKNFDVRAYYIPNPIMIEKEGNFKGRDTKKFSNTILWVGRIDVNEKNIFAVVPIMKEVVAQIPNAKLKILGAADVPIIAEKLKELIKLNQLEKNIEFCGFHTDVSEFYKSADVMLNTSPHEGWSLVISESKFYELPLVFFKLPDNELTRDGKGSIAVLFNNYHAAAKAIVKILTDENFRIKLSAEARASLQPFLDYDIGAAWQRLFEDLENDIQTPQSNFENVQIQKVFLEEIFEIQEQNNNLRLQIQNLSKN